MPEPWSHMRVNNIIQMSIAITSNNPSTWVTWAIALLSHGRAMARMDPKHPVLFRTWYQHQPYISCYPTRCCNPILMRQSICLHSVLLHFQSHRSHTRFVDSWWCLDLYIYRDTCILHKHTISKCRVNLCPVDSGTKHVCKKRCSLACFVIWHSGFQT